MQSLELTPVFNFQFSEFEGDGGKRWSTVAVPPYRIESCREVLLTASPLPSSNQLTGRCDLLGQDEEEEEEVAADPRAERRLAKGEPEPTLPCIFSHKRGK